MLGIAAAFVAAPFLTACRAGSREKDFIVSSAERQKRERLAEEGHLLARPAAVESSAAKGRHRLGLRDRRDALLYVPTGYRRERPAPLALMLHGAGGDEEHGLSLL